MSSAHDRRAALKDIASSTLKFIERGAYSFNGEVHELHTQTAKEGTRFFGPKSSSDLANWRSLTHALSGNRQTQISIVEISTIRCCCLLAAALRREPSSGENINIGVLNFASATKPGGGFLNGAQAQEESIARSSTLYPTLCTDAAEEFYHLHNHHSSNSFHTHAMIYSPSVEIFRDDDGEWIKPVMVDVLTCAAVHAGEVRESRQGFTGRREQEDSIQSAMRERMGRILYLFEKMGVRNIVLGSFGTGVFGNDVDVVAKLWADLLSARSARFKGSFDRVMFAIMGRKTFVEFEEGFNGRQSNLRWP
jgi:uncharacterized protein (TIGR02452 family)